MTCSTALLVKLRYSQVYELTWLSHQVLKACQMQGMTPLHVQRIVHTTQAENGQPMTHVYLEGSPSDMLTPSQRDRMVSLYMNEQIADFTRQRMSAAAKSGKDIGAVASTMKLHWTNGLKVSRDLGIELLGAEGMLVGQDLPAEGTVQHFFLSMPSASIAGGSDEVQHNIIGERALGLPKDVSLDPNTPFRDIPRN